MEARTDEYLMDRHKAAQRYGMSVRALEDLYKRHPDFPIVRRGKRVMVHRPKADAWFDDYVGGEIDMG